MLVIFQNLTGVVGYWSKYLPLTLIRPFLCPVRNQRVVDCDDASQD